MPVHRKRSIVIASALVMLISSIAFINIPVISHLFYVREITVAVFIKQVAKARLAESLLRWTSQSEGSAEVPEGPADVGLGAGGARAALASRLQAGLCWKVEVCPWGLMQLFPNDSHA